MQVLVAKLTGLNTGSQITSTTITLDPTNAACNTAEKFLFNGELWWAGYSSTTTKQNNCCGTN